jgi:hypothetical protein
MAYIASTLPFRACGKLWTQTGQRWQKCHHNLLQQSRLSSCTCLPCAELSCAWLQVGQLAFTRCILYVSGSTKPYDSAQWQPSTACILVHAPLVRSVILGDNLCCSIYQAMHDHLISYVLAFFTGSFVLLI